MLNWMTKLNDSTIIWEDFVFNPDKLACWFTIPSKMFIVLVFLGGIKELVRAHTQYEYNSYINTLLDI